MAQFSSCCISGHIHDGTPEGIETVIAGRKTYVKSPTDETGKAILLIHDIFGYESIVLPISSLLIVRIHDFLRTSIRKLGIQFTSLTSLMVSPIPTSGLAALQPVAGLG